MFPAPRGSKLGTWLLCSLVWFLASCTPIRRPVSPDLLPRRLVLALDGLDYRDVLEARARGRFAAFHEPARLVSTFPSISDIAWHAIFGVQPPAGYQRVFFSTRHRAVLGDALSAIRPIEYEERMDHAFDTKFHHLGAYLISWPVARREVDTDVQLVLGARGRETLYLYNVGPDALQHTRGDIARYLDHLSARLDSLQATYRQRTGRTLEIVVLSDHGHNRGRDAVFIPLTEALAAHGFEASRVLASPRHVAFSVDGVTTGFGVFAHPDSTQRVANLLATVPGVELVTLRSDSTHFLVLARDSTGRVRRASIDWRPPSGAGVDDARYRYRAEDGDPLRLAPTLATLRAAAAIDTDGFAAETTWISHTAAQRFPAALPRIVHGHVSATRNPAPILVSVADDHRVGLGMVSVANRMRPLGGTHGALGGTNALGVVMSNVIAPHDDVAWRVRGQFGGFGDLKEPRDRVGTVRVIAGGDLRTDRFAVEAWAGQVTPPDSNPLVVVAVPERVLRNGADSVWVRFEVRDRDGSANEGRVVRDVALPLSRASVHRGRSLAAWAASEAGLTGLAYNASLLLYVKLEYRRLVPGGSIIERTQMLSTTTLRVAPDGTPWSY